MSLMSCELLLGRSSPGMDDRLFCWLVPWLFPFSFFIVFCCVFFRHSGFYLAGLQLIMIELKSIIMRPKCILFWIVKKKNSCFLLECLVFVHIYFFVFSFLSLSLLPPPFLLFVLDNLVVLYLRPWLTFWEIRSRSFYLIQRIFFHLLLYLLALFWLVY